MKPVLSIFAFLILLHSCKPTVDLEKERKAISMIQEDQRRAHFEKNVELLLSDSSSDFIEVNRGVVSKRDPDKSAARFKAYFNAVDFVRWDDEKPPVITFSDDATMATSVVEKLVITKERSGNNRLDTTHFAWLAVYKKLNGKWKLQQIASTNR